MRDNKEYDSKRCASDEACYRMLAGLGMDRDPNITCLRQPEATKHVTESLHSFANSLEVSLEAINRVCGILQVEIKRWVVYLSCR